MDKALHPTDDRATAATQSSQQAVSSKAGIPSAEETRLIVAEKDKPLAFLDLDDETLGRFARGYLIQMERAVHKHAGNRELPIALAMSMHGAIALYRMAAEANAGELHLTHEAVEWDGDQHGDWEIIVRRKTSGELAPDVRRLVIAARIVAFEDQGPEALRELDQASEAFASRVPSENEDEA